jgi:predicted alpha/beta-hydrolase family hydrolase
MAAPRTIVFAPGAGAPSSSAWMRDWAARLSATGLVLPFDYPYLLAGRRSPDRQPVLVAAHREAYERARADHSGSIVLAGKSMGARMGCHVAVEAEAKPAALVCFGYPLVGQNGKLRDEVLRALETPVLFIQGTRDPLCPLPRLEALLPELRAPHRLHVVDGGDHSLLVTKSALRERGETQADVDARILEVVARFLDEQGPRRGG